MKKHLRKIIAIVCLIAMMSTLAACTQTLQIAFIDESGNVYNPFANIGTGTVNVYSSGSSSSSGSSAAAAPAATPAASEAAPAASEAAPAAETPAASEAAPAAETPAASEAAPAAASTGAPTTTEEIANFYKAAAARIKDNAEAGFTKKEWQTIGEINIGASMINSAVSSLAGSFMTTEEAASDQVSEKGSDDAKNRFPGFTLSDYSKIASATCTVNADGNYDIVMIMADEDTPKKEGSTLGQVTNSLMYWEDIDNELKNNSTVTAVLKSYENVHVMYKGYELKATITPDGKFVTIDHIGHINIQIGTAKILIATIENKSAELTNYCTYRNFTY